MSTTATAAVTAAAKGVGDASGKDIIITPSASTSFSSLASLVGAYVILGFLMTTSLFVIYPVILQMILYSCCCIYIGSHLSLKLKDIDPITGEANLQESMSSKDAMLFPIIGSVSLFSLYCAYKLLSPYWVNMLLTAYLSCLGVLALAGTIDPLIRKFVMNYSSQRFSFSIPLPWPLPGLLFPPAAPKAGEAPEPKDGEAPEPKAKLPTQTSFPISFDTCDIVTHGISVLISICWLCTKHWSFHNLFGICFAIQMISIISLGSFKVSLILLCGLFVYDIFWVFGTDVMVTVAKSFEGPAKLIFPVSFDPWKQSILGLGDIVVPGLMISMTLRLDEYLSHHKSKTATTTSSSTSTKASSSATNINAGFPKIYFIVNLVMYACGLITTGLVMFFFKAAQPALLYLVPFCLTGLWATAAVRGQVKEVWNYKEGEDEDDKKKKAANNGGEKSPSRSPTAKAEDSKKIK